MAKKAVKAKPHVKRVASTGQVGDEKWPDRHAIVLEESGEEVDLPGTSHLQAVIVGGVWYTHVSEDSAGRWVYRKM